MVRFLSLDGEGDALPPGFVAFEDHANTLRELNARRQCARSHRVDRFYLPRPRRMRKSLVDLSPPPHTHTSTFHYRSIAAISISN
jgi:hypothetical protein